MQSRQIDLPFLTSIASGEGKMPQNSRKTLCSGSNGWRQLAGKPRHSAQGFPESPGALRVRALAHTQAQ
jgi:hypothetical protein